MQDVLIYQYVHTKFSDGTLLILLNFWKTILLMNLILTSFKFATIKMVFQKFRRIGKVPSKILCGHTDESKCLAYGHILKTVLKVVEREIQFFVFFFNLIQVHQFTCNPPRWSPLLTSISCKSCWNKRVLPREHKRCTARRGTSTRCAVLSGGGTPQSWPGVPAPTWDWGTGLPGTGVPPHPLKCMGPVEVLKDGDIVMDGWCTARRVTSTRCAVLCCAVLCCHPPGVDRHTPVKTVPSPSFGCRR